MALNDNGILEALAEAIRYRRRMGKFPVNLEITYLVWHADERYIAMDIFDEGKLRRFDLFLEEVSEHGETLVDDVVTS